jgi:hypothetical protein
MTEKLAEKMIEVMSPEDSLVVVEGMILDSVFEGRVNTTNEMAVLLAYYLYAMKTEDTVLRDNLPGLLGGLAVVVPILQCTLTTALNKLNDSPEMIDTGINRKIVSAAQIYNQARLMLLSKLK